MTTAGFVGFDQLDGVGCGDAARASSFTFGHGVCFLDKWDSWPGRWLLYSVGPLIWALLIDLGSHPPLCVQLCVQTAGYGRTQG